MKTIEITVYTAQELKAQFPHAFTRALEHYRTHYCNEIPWMDETVESLKACLRAAGVTLRDWSLGAYNRGNFISVSMDDDVAELHGKRAFAWLENNLFGPLRAPWNIRIEDWRTSHKDRTARFYRTTDGKVHKREATPGSVPPCPFTGYCADDSYLSAVVREVREGATLKDAFERLADTCAKLLEAEVDYQASEECFLDTAEANNWQFTEEGELF